MKIFKYLCITIALVICYVCISLRGTTLELRQAHADESEQASTFVELYKSGKYSYNPNGPHGPTLYYISLFAQDIYNAFQPESVAPSQLDIKTLRLQLLFLFVITLAAIICIYDLGGIIAMVCACVALSLSTLSTIYSCYYIQEPLFALFVLLTCVCAYSFAYWPTISNSLLLGLFVGFTQATKETSILAFLAIAIAVAPKFIPRLKHFGWKKFAKAFGLVFLAALIPFLAFYSSFFSNFKGLTDAFGAYLHFFDKASAAEHTKEFLYYIKLLLIQKNQGIYFGELYITLLAILGIIISFVKKDEYAYFFRYIARFALVYLLFISLIPYKTPWLLLSIMYPICLLAGYAAATMLSSKKIALKCASLGLLLFFAYMQFKCTQIASKRYNSDPRNPFIYVHTVPDFENLINRIYKCSYTTENPMQMPICIYMQNSPWPMPWFLRNYVNKGFWTKQNPPPTLEPFDVIIVDDPCKDIIADKINDENWATCVYGLRENLILTVLIKKELFKKSIDTH